MLERPDISDDIITFVRDTFGLQIAQVTFLPVGWVNNAAYRLAAGDGAEQLAGVLQQRAGPLAVCYTDLHAGNVLVGPDDRMSIVDWDDLGGWPLCLHGAFATSRGKKILRLIADFSTNREYERYNLLDELARRHLFKPERAVRTDPVPFVQSLDDYVESFHSRNGLSLDNFPE